jgi:ubiquinone/menaquinone biosynthesis C-methylase UbiE
MDPRKYEKREERSPREGYLHDHWFPLVKASIDKYCARKLFLDLACGTGVNTALSSQSATQVLGLDFSNVMLHFAKKQHPTIEFILADAYHIPRKDNSIEVVMCIGLFEYIERAMVLEEIKRILKLDGICYDPMPEQV